MSTLYSTSHKDGIKGYHYEIKIKLRVDSILQKRAARTRAIIRVWDYPNKPEMAKVVPIRYSLSMTDIAEPTLTVPASRPCLTKSSQSKEDLRVKQKQLEKDEKRIAELDHLFIRLYEDNVTSRISDDRFAMMSRAYEDEQRDLKAEAEILRQEIETQEMA